MLKFFKKRQFKILYLKKISSFRSHICKMRLSAVIFKHCAGSGVENHKSNLTPCATAFFTPLLLSL